MNTVRKPSFRSGLVLMTLFCLFTLSLTVVDRQPIGPNGTTVAYAAVNRAVHDLFGVHRLLYDVTDWFGVVLLGIAFAFAVGGACQWITRRRLSYVDRERLILGAFYLLVFGAYVVFEYVPVNHRPVLIDGVLEASYPSSTTLLSLCVLCSAPAQLRRRFGTRPLTAVLSVLCHALAVLTVVARSVCGVHWFTDIVGGILFSAAALLLYRAALARFAKREAVLSGES